MADKIYIIEDESTIRRELKTLLENAMYHVMAPENFIGLIPQILNEQPDLILLDVNLPDCSGFDICLQLREQTEIPVIFLTGRTDSMDELNGILKGGDDYITKPYQTPILLARIAAVLKRTKKIASKEPEQPVVKGVQLDVGGCFLCFNSKKADLTKTEMKILCLLYRHAGNYVSRTDLIEYLWENRIFIDDNTLSVHITRIREKLRTIGAEHFIETKRGLGYRI